jgi:hypothetical protein
MTAEIITAHRRHRDNGPSLQDTFNFEGCILLRLFLINVGGVDNRNNASVVGIMASEDSLVCIPPEDSP